MFWMKTQRIQSTKRSEKESSDLEVQRRMAQSLVEVFVPNTWVPFLGNIRKRALKEIMKRVKRGELFFSNLTENSVTVHWRRP